MPIVVFGSQAQCRLLVTVLATVFTIAVADAQAPAEGHIEISGGDPDSLTVEEWIRARREARREAVEAARKDQIAAPPEEVDLMIANVEADIVDPDLDLQTRILVQQALLDGLQGRYTDDHPTVIRQAQRLERLEAQLEEEAATASEL